VIENDLAEAVAYLDSCQSCSTDFAPTECGACDHEGHQRDKAPTLFAGLSKVEREQKPFDVPVTVLFDKAFTGRREGNN
jgi:hypothetical protein